MRKDERGSEILDRGECLRLLSGNTCPVGRVGFVNSQSLATILPVNYVVLNGEIVFRTGFGDVASAVTENQVVAFEIDQVGPETGQCWSVLVRGVATFFADDSVTSGAELPRSLVPVPGSQIVKVQATVVTGRRFSLPTAHGPS